MHDKFCPADTPLGGGCECEVIAAIRADEREKVAQRVAGTKRKLLHYLADKSDSWVCVPLDWAVAAARGEDTSHE